MQVIAISRIPTGTHPADAAPLLPAEVSTIWKLYKSDKIRRVYSRLDQPGVVLFLECRDAAEAKEIVAALPLIISKLIEFEYFPVGPYVNWDVLI